MAGVGALLAILLIGVASAQAAGTPEDECAMRASSLEAGSVCAYVTNRVLRFGDQPGVLAGANITKDNVRTLRGDHRINGPATIDFNDATYDKFVASVVNSTGLIDFRGSTGTLSDARVSVRADYEPFVDKDQEKLFSLTCESEHYLTCETYPVWMKNQTKSGWMGPPLDVRTVTAYATIESRPLIVKILNMTDQPLVRESAPRTHGMLRSERIGDPQTIAASIDDRTGVGYYHFYRDPDRAASATFFYEFADGAHVTTLSGGALEFTVNVAADGSTEMSKCTPPTGMLQNVECSVTMIGIADGTLTALVAVGV
ncbi:MAG: hypothetical protein ACR2J9_03610 [Gaiellales bacterium]